jgi:uronate dehydrogenase
MRTILVTGGNGKMGRCITTALRGAGYDVRSTSRTPNAGLGVTELDIRDADACLKAMQGVDTVIHMAFYMGNQSFRQGQVPTNIVGTWNIYEAAAKCGVKRVVFGSSNHVVGFYRRDEVPANDMMQRPDSPYGLCKGFCELCGRYYSDRYGIEVINVRIGLFRPPEDDKPRSFRDTRMWLSNRDCAQLFRKCVEARLPQPFQTIYGVSGNSDGDFDISGLKGLIGYEPRDNGRDLLEYALSVDRFGGFDTNLFLGGGSVCCDYDGSTDHGAYPELARRHARPGDPEQAEFQPKKASQ